MGVALLVLLAIGALLHPDLRANPVTWVIASLIFLGAFGLVWRHWLAIRADQAMIDTERNTRR
jgi:protein-S-isoprenylcysteine O-methyltransferase Ste14